MRAINPVKFIGVPVLLLSGVVLAGCATISTSTIRYLGAPTLSPTQSDQVEILRREPRRPHERLGEIQLDPARSTPTDEIEKSIRGEAARLGADAAVVLQDRTRRVGTFVTGPWWARSSTPLYGRQIVVIAIKFRP